MKVGRLYGGMVAVVIAFILWTILNRYVWDPDAAGFLSHKLGLKRTFNVPVWLTVLDVHIAFASIALLAGAVNIANWVLRHYRNAHRMVGYAYLFSVLAVVLTSGYMAPYATGGRTVSMIFNLWNLAWIAVTLTAFVYVKRKRFDQHRNWMIRSYTFCFTNLSIHLLLTLLSGGLGLEYVTAYTCSVIGTVVLLPLLAEAVIRTTLKTPIIPNKGEIKNAEYPNRLI
jgi:hypothetical protein